MNIYNLNQEELMKISSEFNNTTYGRKVWLLSKIPEVTGFLLLIIYILLSIFGACNPDVKDLLTYYIIGDMLLVGISILAVCFSEINYWKQVSKYVICLEEEQKRLAEENEKKAAEKKEEEKKQVKKVVKKSTKKETPKPKKNNK